MPANDWTIGLQYNPKWNNIAWAQPTGINGLVYPQEVTGNSDLLSVKPFNELTGVYMFGCGHSANMCMVFQDWDYDTGMSVALLCCPLCTFLQRTIEPFSEAVLNPLQNAILYP